MMMEGLGLEAVLARLACGLCYLPSATLSGSVRCLASTPGGPNSYISPWAPPSARAAPQWGTAD